ncbi:MAG: ornithine--oxo-acid transaminase [Alphaproteobacteria bacterium]|nr:MAG: ornithine--oxo-acid transaminase [Alphaproteobacteria bacterium]
MTTIEKENLFCAYNYHPLPVVLTKGEGVWLWDEDGKKYLDMMSAYSAVSHGHSHPRMVKALCDQAAKLAITSRAYHTDKLAPFLEKICRISGMDMALPMNTGAEAVETAIKAARLWGYKSKGIAKDKAEIIVAEGNFHGRTTTVISFSSEEDYKANFGPLTPGFKIVDYGDIEAMRSAITENTCAILIEPIQGEAGIRIPPAGYLKALRKLCDENNVLLILDEIQSGLGRTGKNFCFEHEGIRPDGLTLGKALGGGMMPVSCFLAKREVMELFRPGSHGSTFGGNPLAAAVATEALTVLEEDKLVENSENLGAYMLHEIAQIPTQLIREVRGLGLWIGVDFDPERVSAREVCERMMERGILSKETHETVVRFAPPLIITREEIDWALEQFKEVVAEIEARQNAA